MTWAALAFGLLLAVVLLPFIAEVRRRPVDDEMRARAPGHFAELPRGLTYYRWTGPVGGPVAVCVHGLTTPSFVFDAIAEELARNGWRVLVYDLYGRGLSDRPEGRQVRGFFIRQLQDLLDHEGVRRDFTLVGYSMGGAIATCYAAIDPARLNRLVLIAPAGMGGFPSGLYRWMRDLPALGDWLIRAVFPRQFRAAARALHRDLGASREVAEAQARQVDLRGFVPAVMSSLRGILGETLETEHRRIAQKGLPVLAVWASRDQSIPLECMGTLTRWNRDARHVQVELAGHWLPITHPDDVVAAIQAHGT